nr:unnamed protein product [Callosobruchus analis]
MNDIKNYKNVNPSDHHVPKGSTVSVFLVFPEPVRGPSEPTSDSDPEGRPILGTANSRRIYVQGSGGNDARIQTSRGGADGTERAGEPTTPAPAPAPPPVPASVLRGRSMSPDDMEEDEEDPLPLPPRPISQPASSQPHSPPQNLRVCKSPPTSMDEDSGEEEGAAGRPGRTTTIPPLPPPLTTYQKSDCGASDMSMHSNSVLNVAATSVVNPLPPSQLQLHQAVSALATSLSSSSAASSCSNRLPSPMNCDPVPVPGPSNMPPVQQVPLQQAGAGEIPEGGNSPPQSHARLYPCMYCGNSFPHQSKLTRHILSHSLETLKYREQQHRHGLPTLVDPALSATPGAFDFATGGRLKHEPPDPTDQPPTTKLELEEAAASGGVVLCKFCGKSFPDVGSLIGHLPVHTGDRPFKCEFCGKAFKLRHHMKDHCRVHTGERPFRCALCGKTFSRSTILKAHEKTHYPKYATSDADKCIGSPVPDRPSSTQSSRSSTPFALPFPTIPTSLLEVGLMHPASLLSAAADDLFRCGSCLASFPSPWLLEQHAALQHVGASLAAAAAAAAAAAGTEKPFVCEQCGQSYRYRSAYVKHREQNHRARLPADKLFSCDVCGMQFRYLKSFKKHRLNHALEKLHGKSSSEIAKDSKYCVDEEHNRSTLENSSDQVSSSNETINIEEEGSPIVVKKEIADDAAGEGTSSDAEKEDTEVDQDDTVDSMVTAEYSPSPAPPSSVAATTAEAPRPRDVTRTRAGTP